MRNKSKRLLSLLLAFCLMLTMSAPAFAAEDTADSGQTVTEQPETPAGPETPDTPAPEEGETGAPTEGETPQDPPAQGEAGTEEVPPEETPAPPAEEQTPAEEAPPVEETPGEEALVLGAEQLATDAAAEWSASADTTWYDDPSKVEFTLTSAEQLAGLAQLVNVGNTFAGKQINLGNDLDLEGRNWTPIGYSTDGSGRGYVFNGVFDGGGHTIRGLEVTALGVTAGLFGFVKASAVIRNLNLEVKSAIATGKPAAAAGLIAVVSNVVATAAEEGTVHDCHITVTGTISANESAVSSAWVAAGALGGIYWRGAVYDCSVDIAEGAKIYGTTSGNNCVGGGIGFAIGSLARNRVRIAGDIQGEALTTNAAYWVGGLVGNLQGGNMKDCYAIIESTGGIQAVGSAVTMPTRTGFGGLVGFSGIVSEIATSYVVNRGRGNISTQVSGGLIAGGVSGANILTVKNCYAYTASAADRYALCGSANIKQTNCALMEIEAEMKQQSTYAGFDFATVWVMDTKGTGYPKIGNEVEMTDADIVASVQNNLNFDAIKGENETQTAIIKPLVLPTEGLRGAKIVWRSSAPNVIGTDGAVTLGETAQDVTLTAVITSGSATATQTFELRVPAWADVPEWKVLADITWYNNTDTTFTLTSEEQLAGLAQLVNAGNMFSRKQIHLGNDLNLEGRDWTPIGYSTDGNVGYAFDGVFDGGGHTIRGLEATALGTTAGLFGFVRASAIIRNLNLEVKSATATGRPAAAAGLVALIPNVAVTIAEEGTVHDCRVTVTGTITTTDSGTWAASGALGGIFWQGAVYDCFVEIAEGAKIYGATSANDCVGGGIGFARNVNFERNRARIAGDIQGEALQTSVAYWVGGFVGQLIDGYVKDCYAIIEPTGSIQAVGSVKTAPAKTGFGGLVGFAGGAAEIVTSYVVNQGSENLSTQVSGGLIAGGVGGANLLTVNNCYAYTASSADGYALCGSANIKQTQSALIATEAAMKQQSTYAGFDFATAWVMDSKDSGYPKIGNEVEMTDAEIVAAIQSNLSFDTIKGENETQTAIEKPLFLPTKGFHGATIVWSSSAPDVIGTGGDVTFGETVQDVTLTASISSGNQTVTKKFDLRVASWTAVTEWQLLADVSWYNASQSTFTISTAEQLAGFAQLVNAGNTFAGKQINLGNDLNLEGRSWTPIGYSTDGGGKGYVFDGVFDGGGYTIRGLEARALGVTAGLFGFVRASAVVRNLNLEVKSAIATGGNGSAAIAAGLIGAISNAAATVAEEGTVHDCRITVTGTISATAVGNYTGVGALGGIFWRGSVCDCFVDIAQGAKVYSASNSNNNIGGYIGFMQNGSIERCRVWLAGDVQSEAQIAGATSRTGGFAGYAGVGYVKDCYAIIESTGSIQAVGSVATTFAKTGFGGLIGHVGSSMDVATSYVVNKGSGNLSTQICGGLIAGNADVASVLTFNSCYAYTASSADGYALCGLANVEQTNSALIATEAEMKQQSTYAGFDFARTWIMDEGGTGYPKIGTEEQLTDAQIIASFQKNFSFELVKGQNTSAAEIRLDLELPANGLNGSTITWTSSDESVLTAAGVVNRPADGPHNVTLTGTIQSGTQSGQVTLQVTVMQAYQFDWNAFWQNYWDTHDRITWSTVGDSITASYMNFSQGYKQYYDWVQYRLNQELGKHVEIINPAIGGWRLEHFNQHAQSWVNNYGADLVTVHFGMNDRQTASSVVHTNFDQMMAQILPTEENIAKGVPADRVIVLLTCQPTPNNQDFSMREVHEYGRREAERYTELGYKVQFIDLYDYFKTQLQYGSDGNLANYAAYTHDGAHVNAYGYYAKAQYIMKNMGLYSEDSPVCTIRHDTLFDDPLAPALTLDYTLAQKKNGSEAMNGAVTTSPGYTTMSAANTYVSMLVLGGAATSGKGIGNPAHRSYPWLIESYLRTVQGKNMRHVITVANAEYDAEWFNAEFNTLKSQYHNPAFILYMPEVNALYGTDYVHSAEQVAAYGTALETFVQKCVDSNIALTLMTPFPLADQEKNGYLKEYVDRLIAVAEAKGVSVCNLYNVYDTALRDAPQMARNWYSADGLPNYISQVEAAKTFLGATAGQSNNTYLFPYLFRNASAASGTQYDNFSVQPTRAGTDVRIDLTALLADPLYSDLSNPATGIQLRRTKADGTKDIIATTYDAATKTLRYDAAQIAESDSLQLVVTNGAATYLNAYTSADVADGVVALKGTVSSYNARNAATLTLYKLVNGSYSDSAAATTTIAAQSGTTGARSESGFTFSAVEPGTYKLVATKTGHQAYVLEGIPVNDADVTLTATLKLRCGDVNGDGCIDMRDRELVNTAMFTLLEKHAAADLNGDGAVNFLDLNILMQTAHFNQRQQTVQYTAKTV